MSNHAPARIACSDTHQLGVKAFNSGNCCLRRFSPALPLRSLENSTGRLVCKLIMGEMGACVIPLLSITRFLPFSIPLAIYPLLLSSCLPFSCSDRSPFDLGVDQISTRGGREEMTPPPLQLRSLGLTQLSCAALFSTGVTSACGLRRAADCVVSIFRSVFSFRRRRGVAAAALHCRYAAVRL